ncbi:hypothetical protein [Scytonema hofmannii]|nr:hypothetical protein [Scytonema hofmannii]
MGEGTVVELITDRKAWALSSYVYGWRFVRSGVWKFDSSRLEL